ncbi:MAG: hypothetical protein V1707_00730 [bacterium]
MGNRSLGDITQAHWLRACAKLGLVIDTTAGKGSHARVIHPSTHQILTIQYKTHKVLNQKIFKTLSRWNFTEDAIWEVLR